LPFDQRVRVKLFARRRHGTYPFSRYHWTARAAPSSRSTSGDHPSSSCARVRENCRFMVKKSTAEVVSGGLTPRRAPSPSSAVAARRSGPSGSERRGGG